MNTSALSAIWSRRPGRSGGRSPLIDACLVAAVVVLQLAGWYATSSGPGHHGRAAGPLSYLLLALGAVSLFARRRYPAAVLAVAMATTLSAGTLGARAAWLVLIAAFVNAVLFRRRLAAIASLVIGYAVSVWPPSAGIAVRLVKEGPARPLPADVGVAAYRIVQEALTNTVRHSGGRSATVRICYDTDALTIEVDDDGRAAAAARGTARGAVRGAVGGEPSGEPGEPGEPARPGNGVAGMAERARALGGTLDAGPRSEGGFRVLARLPA